jgi:hypothetical protein
MFYAGNAFFYLYLQVYDYLNRKPTVEALPIFLFFRISTTEMNNHISSEFPKGGEGGGSPAPPQIPQRRKRRFLLTLAVSAVVPPVALGLGLSICRRSQLLSITSGVPNLCF